MGPCPGLARARPRPVLFSRDRARFLEKGLENWDFYVVKNTGLSRLGIDQIKFPMIIETKNFISLGLLTETQSLGFRCFRPSANC